MIEQKVMHRGDDYPTNLLSSSNRYEQSDYFSAWINADFGPVATNI